MKRVFARFDNLGICKGRMIVTDPSMVHDPTKEGYQEIFNTRDQEMVENHDCKKIIDSNGREKIVLL